MLTRVTDQPAFLLRRRDWQNNSFILELLTRDYGRLSVMARGAKQSKSTGLYQPFCELSLSWAGRNELKSLIAIDGKSIAIDTQCYLPLLYVNELLGAYLPLHEPAAELFELYRDLLNSIDAVQIEACLRKFERAAMAELGYLPDTGCDAEQGEPINAEQFYQFIANRGFISCTEQDANAIKGARIIGWNQQQYDEKPVLQLAKTVMRCIIDFNLHGKSLKSRDVYLQIKAYK